MKIRHRKPDIDDREVQKLEEALRADLSARKEGERPPIPESYWSRLLVETNQEIDRRTSGKALSISWAARVAIPGVVAIIAFFIGLHYYTPDLPETPETLSSVVLSLPPAAVDTLLTDPGLVTARLSVADLQADPFHLQAEQIPDYLIVSGRTQTLMESLNQGEVEDLFAALGNPVQ